MLLPTTAPYFLWFYPLGNTPATLLTRHMPRGIDAHILLLACGDVRNILFTVWQEQEAPSRNLDFTCCDYDVGVVARNIFLLSCLVDETPSSQLFEIFYHVYLNDSALDAVVAQAKKLVAAAQSMQSWQQSVYFRSIKFINVDSLARVCKVWQKYLLSSTDSGATHALSVLKGGLAQTNEFKRLIFSDTKHKITSLQPLVAAAPILSMPRDALELVSHYWETGITTRGKSPGISAANPLFSATLSDHSLLHYATDPVSGFHIATGYASLAEGSPLAVDKQSDQNAESFISIAAARVQFAAWCQAVQERNESRLLTTRWVVAEALSFCHTLNASLSTGANTANLYTAPYLSSQLVLDDQPKRYFDVVDASNLGDHVGLLNVLVAASPILGNFTWATLNTEILLKRGKDHQETFAKLLCGDPHTLFLLLGVSPLQYWSNVSSHPAIFGFVDKISRNHRGGASRLTWVRNRILTGATIAKINLSSHQLAKVLFRVYRNLSSCHDLAMMASTTFAHQNLQIPVPCMQYPQHHCGSFVALLKLVKQHVSSNWDEVCHLIGALNSEESNLLLTKNHSQELMETMTLQGLCSPPTWMLELQDKSQPLVRVVTMVVPRSIVQERLYPTLESRANAAVLCVMLSPLPPSKMVSPGWLNMYASVHVSLGKAVLQDGRVVVQQTADDVWRADNDMIVSFIVSTAALKFDWVSLHVLDLPMARDMHLSRLGPYLTIYELELKDTFVTDFLPNHTGHPVFGGKTDTVPSKPSNEGPVAGIDSASKIVSLTSRFTISTSEGRKALADKVQLQTRPGRERKTVELVFESNPPVVLASRLPLPIDKVLKTIIARTSGYVDVEVQIANPASLSESLWPIFPTFSPTAQDLELSNIPAVSINLSHITTKILPMLDLSPELVDEKTGQRSINWVTAVVASQFSETERIGRQVSVRQVNGLASDTRLNLKETIFTMFVVSAGLQGHQTGVFFMSTGTNQDVKFIFITSTIRIDLAAGSVVLEAAVLPIETELVRRDRDLQKFLVLLNTLVEPVHIMANDEEVSCWRQHLPAMAERCRSWKHTSNCTYTGMSHGAIISTLCNCGKGQDLDLFSPLPDWDEVGKRYFTRVAISPLFPSTIVTANTFDITTFDLNQKKQVCRKCSAKTTPEGDELMTCVQCKTAKYCSKDCQKADWPVHKGECNTAKRKLTTNLTN